MNVWFAVVTKYVPFSTTPPTRPSNGPIFAMGDLDDQKETWTCHTPAGFLFCSKSAFSTTTDIVKNTRLVLERPKSIYMKQPKLRSMSRSEMRRI